MSTTWWLKLVVARWAWAVGLTGWLLHAARRRPVILRYHRVYPDDAEPFYEMGVPRTLFEAQLDYLASHFEVTPLGRLVDVLRAGQPLPERACVITFDDGYRDNFTEALPALSARRLPATLFVSVGNVGGGPPFWWDRLAAAIVHATEAGLRRHGLRDGPTRRRFYLRVTEELKRMPADRARIALEEYERSLGIDPGAGARYDTEPRLAWTEIEAMSRSVFDIGSHGLDHLLLSRLPPAEAERQVVDSKRELEERLVRPIELFAYPNGKPQDVTKEVREAVCRAGYTGAVATVEGRVAAGSDPFFLERIGATRGLSATPRGAFSRTLFAAELAGLFQPVRYASRDTI